VAIYSFPFNGSPLATEAQYALTASRWGNDGVHTDDLTGTDLKVTANGTSNLNIAAGTAFVNGATFVNDSSYTLAVAPNSGGASARKDLVILRYDASAGSITPVYKTGGTSAPDLVNTPASGVVEIPLAEVTVAAGASGVASGAVSDRRWAVGRPVAYGIPGARRPSRKGQLLVEGNDIYLGDGSSWNYVGTAGDQSWSTYTPVWTSGASTVNWGSNSTNRGRYKLMGKTCHLKIQLIPSGNPVTGSEPVQVSLPFPCQNSLRQLFTVHMDCTHGEGNCNGVAMTYPTISTTRISRIMLNNSNGTVTPFEPNNPVDFRTDDILTIDGTYEIA
jgi:hypothetical protein